MIKRLQDVYEEGRFSVFSCPSEILKADIICIIRLLEQQQLQKHQVEPKQVPGMPPCRIVLAGCANASDLQVIALVMSTEQH